LLPVKEDLLEIKFNSNRFLKQIMMSDITTNQPKPKLKTKTINLKRKISIIQEHDSENESFNSNSSEGPDFSFKKTNKKKNFDINVDNLSIKKVDTPKESASDFQFTKNAIDIDNKIKSISFNKDFKNPSEAFNSLKNLIKKESVNNINKGNNSVLQCFRY